MNLPSDFDLHFDIKTLDKLQEEYWNCREKCELIESMCAHYSIGLRYHREPIAEP